MDSFWQNLAIIPLLVWAVIYMAKLLRPNKANESSCGGCQPSAGCGDCSLAGLSQAKKEGRETESELIEL